MQSSTTKHAGCKGCCVFPHGLWMTLLATFMAIVSWGLSVGVHASCFFVQGNDDLQTGFGMWTKQNIVPSPSNDYECQEYTWAETNLFDRKWSSAAAMAYTAGLIGFIFGVLVVGSSCAAYSRAFWKLAGVAYMFAGLFDFLTLIGVQSEICTIFTADYVNVTDIATECTFSTGAILAVIAGVCYFIMAAICFCMPAAREKDSEKDDNAVAAPASNGDNEESAEENVQSTPKSETGADEEDVEMKLQSTKEPVVDTAAPVDESDTSSNESNAEIIESSIHGQGFWTMLSDNLLFVLGSVFFMWLAVMDLDWAKTVQAWLDENVFQEIADYEKADDDYVFETRFHWVSKYQIVYFIAAAAFLIEGLLEFFVTPGYQGIWFAFAGGMGLIAAWLGERNPDLSSIFSLISSCLFVVEAIGLVLYRSNFTGRLKRIIRFNDICFVIATTIDVVVGFTGVFKVYKISLVKLDVSSAALWLMCSVVYIGLTLYAKRKGYFNKATNTQAKEQASVSGKEEADTPPEEQASGKEENGDTPPEEQASASGKEEDDTQP